MAVVDTNEENIVENNLSVVQFKGSKCSKDTMEAAYYTQTEMKVCVQNIKKLKYYKTTVIHSHSAGSTTMHQRPLRQTPSEVKFSASDKVIQISLVHTFCVCLLLLTL